MITIKGNKPELIESLIYEHGVIPFTFNRKTVGGKLTWTTSKGQYSGKMGSVEYEPARINSFLKRVRKNGIHEPIMMDDTIKKMRESKIIVPHELSFEEVREWKTQSRFEQDGTTWLIEKPWTFIYLDRDTHDKIEYDLGLGYTQVYPAADCAVVRIYIPSLDAIVILHLSAENLEKGALDECIKYLTNVKKVQPSEMLVSVGAFASRGWVYKNNVPKFATLKDENDNAILGPDGIPLLNEQWYGFVDISKDENGVLNAHIRYLENVINKLTRNGIPIENIDINTISTIYDEDYSSNSINKLNGNLPVSDLYGMAFIKNKPKSLILSRAEDKRSRIITG